MLSSQIVESLNSLNGDVDALLQQLPDQEHGDLIQQAIATIVRMAGSRRDRLDWKILSSSLLDMERGFEMFYPYRHVRKVTVFGSSRIQPGQPEYQMAVDFSRCVTAKGFMVMTGAGGGIMQAGNEGAGAAMSFGLNIRLPFEQDANPFIAGDEKLLYFKYFFTRKLFLLRESDAIALFPGGFGTQDEAFECLTLAQTGRFGPAPLVLVDCPGGDYWQNWNQYIQTNLLAMNLISPDDPSLYTITDRLDVACQAITDFYRVYHSSRYVKDQLVIRLKTELSDGDVAALNEQFQDILLGGHIGKSAALPEELGDETVELPRLVLQFNQRDLGRLYQMIGCINQMGAAAPESAHPEEK